MRTCKTHKALEALGYITDYDDDAEYDVDLFDFINKFEHTFREALCVLGQVKISDDVRKLIFDEYEHE